MRAEPERLMEHVRALEGERHPRRSPEALAAAEDYVHRRLEELGLDVDRRPFRFRGREFRNVVGILPGDDPDRPRVLVGAHFDTVPGSPGADDNGSAVAVMLETARLLSGERFPAAVEFVGFNLEEPQGATYRVGSRRYAADARERGVGYAGCLILEMVGYTDSSPGSQRVPWMLFWKRVPDTGTFLAATGDSGSRDLLREFRRRAGEAVPDREVVTFRTPLRGRIVPLTRLSDNASFWDRGYPALMVTDTAFLRNPNYHRPTDRSETLDPEFMRDTVEAVAATVRSLASD